MREQANQIAVEERRKKQKREARAYDRSCRSPPLSPVRRRAQLSPPMSPRARFSPPMSPTSLARRRSSFTVREYPGRAADIVFAEWFAGLGLMTRWGLTAAKGLAASASVVGFTEVDPVASRLLGDTFGQDIPIKNAYEIPDLGFAHMVFCGFPCKGTSTMSRTLGREREALDNGQSGLVFKFFHALRRTPPQARPRMLLLENVRGILSARHDGVKGRFMRWLIGQLQDLGYVGEWSLFSSGDTRMSGDRVFIQCRQLGINGQASLLHMRYEMDPGMDISEGFGFVLNKPDAEPMRGRLPCVTSGAKTCFVYADATGYKCWALGIEHLAELFTLEGDDMECGALASKQQELLANACRPVGKSIVDKMVRCHLGKDLSFHYPPGAEPYQTPDEPDAMPSSGYWGLDDDSVMVYKSKRVYHFPTRLSSPDNTTVAWARSLSRNAEVLTKEDIMEYMSRFLKHSSREKRLSSKCVAFLAAIHMAAHPKGSILCSKTWVTFTRDVDKWRGRVRFDPVHGKLPHVMEAKGASKAETRVLFVMRDDTRGYAWNRSGLTEVTVKGKFLAVRDDVESLFVSPDSVDDANGGDESEDTEAHEEEEENVVVEAAGALVRLDGGDSDDDFYVKPVDAKSPLPFNQDSSDDDDETEAEEEEEEEEDSAVSETDAAPNRGSTRAARAAKSPTNRRERRYVTRAPYCFMGPADDGMPTQTSRGLGYEMSIRNKRRHVFDLERLHSQYPAVGDMEEVWKHIREHNNSYTREPDDTTEMVGGHFHDRYNRGTKPRPAPVTCGKCAGIFALHAIVKGDTEKAVETVKNYKPDPR